MQHEWREGNRVILLPEASRFLPAMFEAVSQAQHYVLVELYLMESGELANQVIDALAAATRRGVKTYLLLDGYGAMGLERSDRERLQAAGVALQLFNPIGFHSLARNLSRDHRKIVVVDGEVAFTGGFGAVDEFLEAWYEIATRVEGPVVADWVHWQEGTADRPEQITELTEDHDDDSTASAVEVVTDVAISAAHVAAESAISATKALRGVFGEALVHRRAPRSSRSYSSRTCPRTTRSGTWAR